MSIETVHICDVVGCPRLSTNRLPFVTISSMDDQGFHVKTLEDVDFCAIHDYTYKTKLPTWEIDTLNNTFRS